jgi:ribosome-binding protein aMBF1 (putative translation factor)
MILCDLCGQSKECLQKEIDGKEYDICSDCWNPLAEKLKGKGRAQKSREIVLLPPPRVVTEREDDKPKPLPGEPPKIWGAAVRLN